MKSRRITYWFVILLALVLIVPTYVNITSHRAQATPTTYYVDSFQGGPNCNGTYETPDPLHGTNCPFATVAQVSTHAAFQPGDTIAFEEAETWTEPNPSSTAPYLAPQGSGIGIPVNGVITITDYCYGQSPDPACTDGNGIILPTLDGNGDIATVELYNQQYWVMSNLHIMNCGSCAEANRKGVWVFADSSQQDTNPEIYHHIVVSGLKVDHVVGIETIMNNNESDAKVTGGIIFQVMNAQTHPHQVGAKDYPTEFDDITISNNIVHAVHRSGIFVHSDWQGCIQKDCSTYPCTKFNNNTNWYPATRVVVDRNTVHKTGGSGIGVQVSTGQVISNNIVHDGQQDKWRAEGISTLDSYQPVYKYNQVYNMMFNGIDGTLGQTSDAVAFDTDYCDYGAIIEYNFTHDNQGGFMVVVQDSQQAIVRYNISERDGYGDPAPNPAVYRDFIVNNNGYDNSWSAPTGNGMQVYDNDIYMDDQLHYWSGGSIGPGPGTGLLQYVFVGLTQQPLFENNLIENMQTDSHDGYASCSQTQLQLGGTGTVWLVNYNDFYGTQPGGCPDLPTQSSPILLNPNFPHPGSGASALTIQGVIDDYKLPYPNGSPALCTGTIVTSSGGFVNGGQDFAQFSLPSSSFTAGVDAGALQSSPTCH